jgi:hypothetical protein
MISWLRSMQLPDRVGEPLEMEGSDAMTLDEILQDIHALEEDMLAYERKYNVLTETFYESYVNGEEPPDDTWVLDWNDWAGTYEIWLRRREQYRKLIQSLRERTDLLANVIAQAARRESLSIPA